MDKKKRPLVFLCTGMSLDGKISNYKKQQTAIAADDDWEFLYEHRIMADAVMVGGNTLLFDDPKLLVKTKERQDKRIKMGKAPEPVKAGVVSDARSLDLNGDFLSAGDTEKVIFTTERTPKEKIRQLERRAKVFVLGEERVDLEKAMEILRGMGIEKLMVEGGGTLIFSLLEKELVDEINLKIGNLVIGGKDCTTFVDGRGFDALGAKKAEFVKVEKYPNYFLIKAKVIY